MTQEKILVLGGAGFIGSHTIRSLIENDYDVYVVDNLERQVHGRIRNRPISLPAGAKFIRARISDRKVMGRLITKVGAIIHLAAAVGVGQSMYKIHDYVEKNTSDTAAVLDMLVNQRNNVTKLIVASSMSTYGEGQYFCNQCKASTYPIRRDPTRLSLSQWDPTCDNCETILSAMPTTEEKPLNPTSIYALSKRHQEEMCLLIGRTYDIPTVALRFFNAYGPGQSLSNPYTGVCAIFASRLMNNKSPHVFEDGKQTRDFVHVSDIVQAILLSLRKGVSEPVTINVGTGKPTSVLELAESMIQLHGSQLAPHISRDFRKGDVRHCYADISRAKKLLGFEPKVELKQGLEEFSKWATLRRNGFGDMFDRSLKELEDRQIV